MRSMGSPKLGDGGQVLDPGTDLNMEGGLAEHAKVSSCAMDYCAAACARAGGADRMKAGGGNAFSKRKTEMDPGATVSDRSR